MASYYYVQVDTSDNNKVVGFAPYLPSDRTLFNDAPNNLAVRPDSDSPIAGDPPSDLIEMSLGQDPVYNYRYNDTTDELEAL